MKSLHTKKDMEQNFKKDLSKTIDLLRFPLAICVIFIHVNPDVVNLIDANWGIFTHKGMFNILGITLSHVLTQIAVPCFFLISGLLFFRNVKEWNWIQYKRKLKSRVWTLFIPYMAWNITSWIVMVVALYLKGIFISNSLDKFTQFLRTYNFNII